MVRAGNGGEESRRPTDTVGAVEKICAEEEMLAKGINVLK